MKPKLPDTRDLRRAIQAHTIGADQARRLGIFCWNPHTLTQDVGRRVMLVETWFRDCDCAESTSITAYPATLRTYDHLYNGLAEDAEGPFSLSLINPADVPYVPVGTRDRALEAFEDGHPHSIHD